MLEKLKQKLKNHWEQNKWQIVGLLIIAIPSLVLGFLQEWGAGFGLLIIMLIYDLILIEALKQISITRYTRSLLPGWADKLIMIGIFLLIVRFSAECDAWGAAYWFTEGTVNGHLNWSNQL